MIEELLARATDPTAEVELRHTVDQHIRKLIDSDNRGDRKLVAQAEAAVRADPAAFSFDATGTATLTVAGSCWNAGRFETPSIGELRKRSEVVASHGDARARLWVFDGASPATDIGGLQATMHGNPLFQVASQFNCLESPGPHLARVQDYFSDWTQGPRASVSAFPATLLRHYAAPARDGGRFVQGDGGRQIDLLADVFARQSSPVHSGYLTGHGGVGAKALASALESRFDQIRVGVHSEAQVVLGYNWDGSVEDPQRRIAQVFTSTVAAGGYGGATALGTEFVPVCRQLLRAAYLGTMLAAVTLNRTPVVLTLIGGGVFGNPVELIWESILWAFDEAKPLATGAFDVILNGHNLGSRIKIATLLPAVLDRGGAIIRFDSSGLAGINR